MGFDIIGDIHGQAERLEALLRALGYRVQNGVYGQTDRQAVFVGDLIDRGPGQLHTLQLVRGMVEAGTARITMGNHELNALGWATRDEGEGEGVYLRPRHGPQGLKNRRQHEAFLAEVGEDSDAHRSWVEWFASLPVFIEDSAFRVVHACWDARRADRLRPYLATDHSIRPDALPLALRKGNEVWDAVNVLLKGAEVDLPPGVTFVDKDGHERHEIRTRWWDPAATTYRAAYMGPEGVDVPDIPIPDLQKLPQPDRPTFIGHYWLDPRLTPAPLSPLVACVDYSVAKGGPLVAYRYEGEEFLTADHFVAI